MQSLVNILEKYYKNKSKDDVSDVKKLYTIHRLDRLTSGLVIFGKTSSVAKAYSKCIMNRSSKKIYLARVAGKFPLKCRGLKKLSSKQFVQSGIPVNGEWNDETLTGDEVGDPQKNQASSSCSNEKEKLYSVARLRHQHALACWTEDGNGTPIFGDNGESETDMLERVFRCRHSVDEWLESIDKRVDEKEERRDLLWFHLACPTRIAKHKDGVCEAGSFDDLDDDLYKKTVKPAHSSFGVVSYDESTDSTLLVRRKLSTVSRSYRDGFTVFSASHHFCPFYSLDFFHPDLSTLYWSHSSASSTLAALTTLHCQ